VDLSCDCSSLLSCSCDSPERKNIRKHCHLIRPLLQSDGIQRFSTWVNSNKSTNLVTDPNDREFNEGWPRGRFNHYLFDMNRDWLPVQLPESQARIKHLKSGCLMFYVISMKWELIQPTFFSQENLVVPILLHLN
jgi:hypothetical protein